MRRDDVEAGLRRLGMGAGDIVLLHSSLSSLGHVEGGARTLVEAFLRILGPGGTLVVPTFGDLGVVTRVVHDWPGAHRSLHPLASVAAVGAAAEAICRDHWQAPTAHGADTPYLRIADLGGSVCLLGVDQDRNTTLHTVETLLELPYLDTRTETFETPEGEVTRTWRHFPGPHRAFIGLDRRLREAGLVRVGRIGPAVVRLMQSRPVIDHLLEVGRLDPAFALCDNPNCADCVAQRAAIAAPHREPASFTLPTSARPAADSAAPAMPPREREAFTLAASARLAGATVPQILEACGAAGVTRVELDGLDGKGISQLEGATVRAAVARLRGGGCQVVALRADAVPASPGDLVALAGDCAVRRLVAPLQPGAAALAETAAAAGVQLSLYNTTQTGAAVRAQLDGLRDDGLDVGLTFSPGAFARSGEKPFLESYRNRLKPLLDQLDIEDATFDGRPAPLARGNGEILELISILRCSSFDGCLCLSAGNREAADLARTASAFWRLVDSL